MVQRSDGAYPQCCGNVGYLSSLAPTAKDAWALHSKSNGLYFYPSSKWPDGMVPVAPMRDRR